ncbi:hypothetical protein Tco_1522707, partial [Tanacetum coccineum]
NLLIAKIEALKDNPTPSSDFVTKSPSTSSNFFLEETNTFNNSLPQFETFNFIDDHTKETSSGNTTTHANISLPEYDSFHLDSEPDSGDFTMDVVEDIFDNPTREPRVHVPNVLPTHPTLHLDSDFTLSSDFLGSDLVVSFPSGTRFLIQGYSLKSNPRDFYHRLNFLSHSSVFLLFQIAPDFEASRAHGFVLRSLEHQILSFIMGIQYPNLID